MDNCGKVRQQLPFGRILVFSREVVLGVLPGASVVLSVQDFRLFVWCGAMFGSLVCRTVCGTKDTAVCIS